MSPTNAVTTHAVTSHVLDTSLGRPAAGVKIVLERSKGETEWQEIGRGTTDAGGRASNLVPEGARLERGIYRLTFDTASYFGAQGLTGLYPNVPIVFEIRDAGGHYHLPLLLSPYGYSTYRGS
jgi:5-hydroxyisourate hydrolase